MKMLFYAVLFFMLFLLFIVYPVNSRLIGAEPNYGTATVDGAYGEWDTSTSGSDFFAYMYRAGDSSKDELTALYLRYDCVYEIMYVFVRTLDLDIYALESETWVALNNNGNKQTFLEFEWINEHTVSGREGTYADGWEATFSIAPGENYQLKVHNNVYDPDEEDDPSQTAGTGFIDLDITCRKDWGDAHSSFGEASQVIAPKRTVQIGGPPDAESSHQSSDWADGDDNNGDDEDGVELHYVTDSGGIYEYTITVTIGPYETAQLTGWAALQATGSFGSNFINETINNSTGSSNLTTTFSDEFNLGSIDPAYVRVRLDADYSTLSSTGSGGVGEVEDYYIDSSTDPVAVKLTTFKAVKNNNSILITWNVQSELNHAGYNVHRSTSRDGEYEQLNASLITSEMITDVATAKTYEYLDETARAHQDYYYKLEDISLNGESTWHGPVSVSMASDVGGQAETVNEYKLVGNYPNPFNPSTTIEYTIASSEYVELTVYSMTGQRVAKLVSTQQPAGRYRITWNAVDENNRAVPSGTYFYRLTAGDFTRTGKMLLLK